MLTYLLRKTVLNYKDNAAIIQSKLSEIGLIVADDKAKEFAMAKYAHALFYIASIYMAISGLAMYFREKLGLSKDMLEPIKELHELAFWFFLLFIVAHIAGVIKAELTTDKGLISEMFNGGDKT